MGKKITRYAWLQGKLDSSPEQTGTECTEYLEDLEKFYSADQSPVRASKKFEKKLKEKLLTLLKNKYYLFFALAVLFLT